MAVGRVSASSVDRLGDELVVRLPRDIAVPTGLMAGDRVEVEVLAGQVVIHRLDRAARLAKLFAARRPEQWRAEYANAYDWGRDVGREAIDE